MRDAKEIWPALPEPVQAAITSGDRKAIIESLEPMIEDTGLIDGLQAVLENRAMTSGQEICLQAQVPGPGEAGQGSPDLRALLRDLIRREKP